MYNLQFGHKDILVVTLKEVGHLEDGGMIYLPEDVHFSLHVRLLVAPFQHDLDCTRFFHLLVMALEHHSKLTPVNVMS